EVHRGRVRYGLGEYCQAIDLLERAAKALRKHSLELCFGGHSTGLPFLVRALVEIGEFRRAVRHGKQSLQVYATTHDAFGLVHSHFALGYAHLRKGDFDQALQELEQGLHLARTKAVAFLEPLISAAVGLAHAQSGRTVEGLQLLAAGVHGATRMGHRSFVTWLECWLAEGYSLAEQRADAVATATRVLEASRQAGRRGGEAHVLHILGDLASVTPINPEGTRYYTAALRIATQLGMRPLIAHCHLGLGKLHRRRGEHRASREHLATATTMYRNMDMRFWLERATAEMKMLRGDSSSKLVS